MADEKKPDEEAIAPGISKEVERCEHCKRPVRVATLRNGQKGHVDLVPRTFINVDGTPLTLFSSHAETCPNPPVIHTPGGGKVVLQ